MNKSNVQKKNFTAMQNTLYDRLTALTIGMPNGVNVHVYEFGDKLHCELGENLYVRFSDSLTRYDIDRLTREFSVGFVMYEDRTSAFVISERDQ